MAENNTTKGGAPTHTAFAFKREGRKFGRWLEIGVARADEHGVIRVFLDRMTYGFTGGVMLAPVGMEPPIPEPPPRRPGHVDEDDELDS